MLFAFLLFGTPWFWCALLLPALFLLYLIENEKAVGALLTVAITAAVFVAFGDKNLIPWVQTNPLKIAEGVVAYIIIGIVWGFVKWFFHVLRARDKYEQVRKAFIADADQFRLRTAQRAANDKYALSRGQQQRTPTDQAAYDAMVGAAVAAKPAGFDKALFQTYVAAETSLNLKEFPPSADRNKGRIIFWMSYWPFSAVWTLINDPITRFYRFIYNRLGAALQRISHSLFAKYKDDLPTEA